MAKPTNRRLILKAAVAIQSILAGRRSDGLPELPAAAWMDCCRLRRLLSIALDKGDFPLAAGRLRSQLNTAAERFLTLVRGFSTDLTLGTVHQAGALEIVEELRAIEEEFGSVSINCRETTASVTTEPIELQDVYLGRFRITLDWQQIGNTTRAFSIEALEPNPAASMDSYVHPHVDDETLCAGDGKLAIEAALSQGRICDFFVLVRQILNTYNSGSAYVQLDDWFDSECRDCGDSTPHDDMRQCDRCDTEICRHCVSGCGDCCDDFCSDCTSGCADCDSETCATCLNDCEGCGKRICERCFEDGECPECQQNHETRETAAQETISQT